MLICICFNRRRRRYESIKLWERDRGGGNSTRAFAVTDADVDTKPVVAGTLPDSAAPEDVDADTVEKFNDEVVRAMVGELATQVESDDAAGEPYTGALLAVMSSLADEHRDVRRLLKSELLPREWDKRALPEVGESVRARLTRQLRGPGEESSHIALFSPFFCYFLG